MVNNKLLLASTVLTAGLGLLASNAALAQLPTAQEQAATGQANPGRIQEQLLQDRGFGDVGPSVQERDLILDDMPANAADIRFNLNQIVFDGVGTYNEAQIKPLYADKLGTNVSLADIYAIATALTNKYRNDGYILTRAYIPPQTIDGGVVTIKTVEGFVDKIRVSGTDQESALRTVRAYANRIRNEGPLNVQDLEKFLLLINDLPGVTARSVLRKSKTTNGASDLEIIIERNLYDAVVGVNSFGSRYLGPIQFNAGGAINSFFGNNERISGQFVTAPHNAELYFFSLGYDQPIGTYGTMIKALYSHSNTEPGFDLDQFDVNGKSDFASIKVEHPFMRSRARSLVGHVAFDWRDVQSRNILEPTREDRIRAIRAGGRYDFMDNLFTAGINSFSVEVSQGLNVLGASNENDVRLSRPAADPTFLKINADAQRLQRVTSSVNLLLSASGQIANDALLSSEEFGVGGINSNRGYDPSEIVGDDGVSGTIELQWNTPYPIAVLENYDLFGFYDIGKVWNEDATTDDDDESAASAGFGINAEFPHQIDATFGVAWPLTRTVQTQGDEDPRFYFSLDRTF